MLGSDAAGRVIAVHHRQSECSFFLGIMSLEHVQLLHQANHYLFPGRPEDIRVGKFPVIPGGKTAMVHGPVTERENRLELLVDIAETGPVTRHRISSLRVRQEIVAQAIARRRAFHAQQGEQGGDYVQMRRKAGYFSGLYSRHPENKGNTLLLLGKFCCRGWPDTWPLTRLLTI